MMFFAKPFSIGCTPASYHSGNSGHHLLLAKTLVEIAVTTLNHTASVARSFIPSFLSFPAAFVPMLLRLSRKPTDSFNPFQCFLALYLEKNCLIRQALNLGRLSER